MPSQFIYNPTSNAMVPMEPTRPYMSRIGGMLTEKEKAVRYNKIGNFGGGGDMGGGYGGSYGANTSVSSQGSFFSPQLSTDFLELPQSPRERREVYLHYYRADAGVAQAIDLLTELPLSKIRLAKPKPSSCPTGFESPSDYGDYILYFYNKMCKKLKLLQRLLMIAHHTFLDGSVFPFCEDSDVEVPRELTHKKVTKKQAFLEDDGTPVTRTVVEEEPYSDAEDKALAYKQKHYKGWAKLLVLPFDQVKMTSFSFTDEVRIELIPSERDRQVVELAKQGDPVALEMYEAIPEEVRMHLDEGNLIPLGTDPYQGSFVYHFSNRKNAGEDFGHSLLDRNLRNLTLREKLRQAQTQIASRAMTPRRLVWGENLSEDDVENLREQVDMALVDPDYSIVTNFEVHWEEMSSRDRLLDLSSEYEQSDKYLMMGFGVTESLMTGESLFSGDRIKLEVLNNRFLLFRELIQEYVEEYIFRPVARKKGFVEKNKWGEEEEIFPSLSFTRLALKDNQDLFDALFNLYQKGSIDVGVILELFNIDPDSTREKIERDMFTVNDSAFNEALRGAYGEVGRALAEKTDLTERIAKYLRLKMAATPEEGAGDRF